MIGRTQSWEAELFLNNPPVELYFMPGMKSKNLPDRFKGVIPHRPICRAWLINEGPTDLYFDFGSIIEGSNDLHLTSMLRGGGEANGVSEGREFKVPENTITALFLQPQSTLKNPEPLQGRTYVRLETMT